jgi:hypothetical protein
VKHWTSRLRCCGIALLLALPPASPLGADTAEYSELQQLARAFFEWRRAQQPVGGDDIPRVERPKGWVPDWSPQALEEYGENYRHFIAAVDAFETTGWTISQQVDQRALRAAIQRVHWELEVLREPRRNPLFYVQQTLGSVFELLILTGPIDDDRATALLERFAHIPETLKHARKNLDEPVGPFAEATIATLADIDERLDQVAGALVPEVSESFKKDLQRAINKAEKSLISYQKWLARERDGMREAFAIGPDAYSWFLGNVALVPNTPGELLLQGRQAWNRAVAWDVVEQNRNAGSPELPIFPSMERQIQVAELRESEIRAFLEAQNLMTVPEWLRHYRSCPLPGYLAPLAFLGVTDDLTSETRLDEDACTYIREPSPDLPYFYLSAARDPRPLIIHEGVPGHYFQMALSWAQENPIRRRYIDSSVNEGIAFYVEELLLQAGLFDFSPRSREIIYSYARLRALRVEVDIRLATGDFTIEQAADYLARTVPMDHETALEEAVFFAFNPGQAISYQVGKLQILEFLADARLDRGEDFSLLEFHDFLMRNGNVPIALQRWEYLGRKDAVYRLDALGGGSATVPR